MRWHNEIRNTQRAPAELDCIFMENRYLKAENKRLREENEFYSNGTRESIKKHEAMIGELLTGLIREIKED